MSWVVLKTTMRGLLLTAATFYLVANIVNLAVVDFVESESKSFSLKFGIWRRDLDGVYQDIACNERDSGFCEFMQEGHCTYLKWSNALSTGFTVAVFLMEVVLIVVKEKDSAFKEDRPMLGLFVFISRFVCYLLAFVFLASVCSIGQSIVDDDKCNMESGDVLKVSWAFWTAGSVFILADILMANLSSSGSYATRGDFDLLLLN